MKGGTGVLRSPAFPSESARLVLGCQRGKTFGFQTQYAHVNVLVFPDPHISLSCSHFLVPVAAAPPLLAPLPGLPPARPPCLRHRNGKCLKEKRTGLHHMQKPNHVLSLPRSCSTVPRLRLRTSPSKVRTDKAPLVCADPFHTLAVCS